MSLLPIPDSSRIWDVCSVPADVSIERGRCESTEELLTTADNDIVLDVLQAEPSPVVNELDPTRPVDRTFFLEQDLHSPLMRQTLCAGIIGVPS